MDISYGPQGDKLRGKNLMIATTTGRPAEACQTGGYNQFTLSGLQRPLHVTANLAGRRYEPVFVVTSVHTLDDASLDRTATTRYAGLAAF